MADKKFKGIPIETLHKNVNKILKTQLDDEMFARCTAQSGCRAVKETRKVGNSRKTVSFYSLEDQDRVIDYIQQHLKKGVLFGEPVTAAAIKKFLAAIEKNREELKQKLLKKRLEQVTIPSVTTGNIREIDRNYLFADKGRRSGLKLNW